MDHAPRKREIPPAFEVDSAPVPIKRKLENRNSARISREKKYARRRALEKRQAQLEPLVKANAHRLTATTAARDANLQGLIALLEVAKIVARAQFGSSDRPELTAAEELIERIQSLPNPPAPSGPPHQKHEEAEVVTLNSSTEPSSSAAVASGRLLPQLVNIEPQFRYAHVKLEPLPALDVETVFGVHLSQVMQPLPYEIKVE